jgi:hypothetical protein
MLSGSAASADQWTDKSYSPHLKQPAYVGDGPVIAIDEGHRNAHTLSGSYGPFGRLAAADGYRPRSSTTPFSADALRSIDILLIANARAADGAQGAFTPDEIQAVGKWVSSGGSLFLIADHAPFGTAAESLAGSFGVLMDKGYVVVPGRRDLNSDICFEGRWLGAHPIIEGRNRHERVRRVTSFTGQSLSIPAGATSILTIPKDAIEVASQDLVDKLRKGERVTAGHPEGRSQLLALRFGRGRVVVAGEAAMFTAQKVEVPRWGVDEAGLTVDDDQQLTLNVLHWLSGLLD